MTTTYDTSQLATSMLYQVRFNLGDTDLTSAQLQDEEIAWAVVARGSVFGACAMCATALSAKYSRLTAVSADGVSQALNQKADQFAKLAVVFQRKEAIYRAQPSLGGVSIADMQALLADTDHVPSLFRIGINDNPPSDGVAPSNEPSIGTDNFP